MPSLLPSFRRILFRLHWALGLTAGLVLALMGATGALMSYEEGLIAWVNNDRTTVAVRDAQGLSPEVLMVRVATQLPGLKLEALALPSDPATSVRAIFARDPQTRERPASVYLNPYDGSVLGPVRWEEAFATIRTLHRWLLLPGGSKGWGRTITGACALAMLVFLSTGIYLRWPQVHRWRIWLKPSLGRPGRARWWSLHAVAGTWLVPVYLVMTLSGLTWSYEWFKEGATWLLTGTVAEVRLPRTAGRKEARQANTKAPPPAIDQAWSAFRAAEGRDAAYSILSLPDPDAKAIRIRWFARGAEQPKARNEASFDTVNGILLATERFAAKPLGRQIAESMLEVHRGRFFGDVFALVFFLAALAMPGFAATGLTLYVLRRRASIRRKTAPPKTLPIMAREGQS